MNLTTYNIWCVSCGDFYIDTDEFSLYELETEYGFRTFMECPVCHGVAKVQGQKSPNLGRVDGGSKDKISPQREEYFNTLVQPYRDGKLAREFVEAHPRSVKRMLKDGVVTPDEVKNSKHVWKDLPNWKYRQKTR